MPARSKIAQLPADVLQELHLRVIHSGFSGYENHAAWLKDRGHDISYSAVWRYFREVRNESQAMLTAISVSSITAKLHAALARDAGEDYSLAAEHMLQVAEFEGVRKALAQGEIAIADLADFQKLSQSQRLTRLRAARERTLQESAAPGTTAVRAVSQKPEEAKGEAAKGGDPMDAVRRVRREVYGILDE